MGDPVPLAHSLNREVLDQLRHEIVDIESSALARRVAEPAQHFLARGDPAVFRDDLGE